MMEEVSHPEGAGTLNPLLPTQPPRMTSSPPKAGLTPPPQGPYPASSAAAPPSPQAYYQPPPSTSYSPQGSSHSQTIPGAPPPIAQPGAAHGNALGASTIILPDMPDYCPDQHNQTTSNSGGMWGWIKSASQNTFVQSVMEKTKTGVDRVITTLDPGMTPYLKQGGNIFIVVASEKEVKWGAVREAFQKVFGKANVQGMPAQSGVAPQPVGYAAGLRGAHDRISYLRRSGLVDERQLCVAVESFIAELLPDKWFDIACIVLQDPAHNINLEMFTQAVPVSAEIIAHIQSATPSDYNLSWSGLSVTIGQAFQHHMPWIEPTDWHKTLTGQSRKAIIYDSTLTLAGLYQEKLPKFEPGQPI